MRYMYIIRGVGTKNSEYVRWQPLKACRVDQGLSFEAVLRALNVRLFWCNLAYNILWLSPLSLAFLMGAIREAYKGLSRLPTLLYFCNLLGCSRYMMLASVYIMYIPNLRWGELPFRDGKGSRAALEGATRERGGAARDSSSLSSRFYEPGLSTLVVAMSAIWLLCLSM